MEYTLLVVRLMLSAIMVSAGVMKLREPSSLKSALRLSGFNNNLSTIIATFLPALEISLGISILFATSSSLRYSLFSCVALLVAFTGWMVWIHTKRINVSCGCFGNSNRNIGISTLVRNATFIIIASTGFFLSLKQSIPFTTLPTEYTPTLLLTTFLLAFILIPAFATVIEKQRLNTSQTPSSLNSASIVSTKIHPRRRFVYRIVGVLGALIAASRLDTALALVSCATGVQACKCNSVNYDYVSCAGCNCDGLPGGTECWAQVYRLQQYSCCTPDANAGKVCSQVLTPTYTYVVCCVAPCPAGISNASC
jgi:uncharacterized membrane protein YphA (DoxX/SURF4 family)